MARTQTEAEGTPADHTDLWLDDFAGMLGFRWVAAQSPWDLPPSYLYAIVTIVISFYNRFFCSAPSGGRTLSSGITTRSSNR